MKPIVPLGDSPFHYDDYTIWRFMHYWQQVAQVMRLEPHSVLEIGPGDHTVGDFLTRKGIKVVAKGFIIHRERINVNTNCIFWVLSRH